MRANTVSSDSIKARALGDRSAAHRAGKNAGALAGAPNVRHLNETRRALLTEIDNAKFSWFHVKVAFVSGAGFFTDAYDIFAINIVSVMLGYLYGTGIDSSFSNLPNRHLTTAQEVGIKIATPAGVLFGQLLFGWLADVLGRKRIYGMELMLIIVATFGQTLCAPGIGVSMMGILTFWRFMMGIGIGGDYPISAVISSEFSSVYIRGRVMTAVFANQGWGQLCATLFSFIIVSTYKRSFIHDDPSGVLHALDQIWRLIIGLGCIPGAIALYFRLTIPETPRFTIDIERNIRQAGRDLSVLLVESETYTVDPDAVGKRVIARQATRDDFRSYFSRWENLKILIGTAYSWFALDIAFYGLGLNSSIILSAIGFGSPKKGLAPGAAVYQNLHNASLGNIILSMAGLVPGYWATFIFIDRWGRKPIQFMGFAVLTVLFLIMGFAYERMNATSGGRAAFVVLYCIANFFENFGPNTTTFIIPGEVFPTRYRATAHGISAASGKFGAVVAQLAFQWLKDVGGPNKFLDHILEIFAFFMFTGILSTLLIPETNQKTLEMLSNESQDDFIQPVPASDYAGSGYLSDFEPTPIRLNPLESPSSPSRPPTAFSARGRRKGTSVSSHGERYASMSDLSVNS
ncbi:inorganic phosphate transporter [Trametes versicolor FP-101664 SS1]|uniref:inorganic phosphate transporter n=1 Tax=Trametes versicolor (strain FP-101664) TaxID=717944 RepID=UPI0004622281|nr:inorganic phosphate transporter [Trametes versicolor FP-101664 SS1]EIW57720.1 inorganic phosphate transporter [Trametes versicolor FP-101664 SS1]